MFKFSRYVGLFVLIVTCLAVVGVNQTVAAPPQQNTIVGYYYILTGFNGSCINVGGGNVAIRGDFTRLSYLPQSNSHTATFSNPYSISNFHVLVGGSPQAGAPGYLYVDYQSNAGPAPLTVTVIVNSIADGVAIGSTSITVTCNAVGLPPVVQTSNGYAVITLIQDGRLNTDLAAPVIVYKNALRLFVPEPDKSRGIHILTISDETIAAVGIPGEPTVLGTTTHPYSGQSVTVYRLPSGEFQMNTAYADGKPYIFVWSEDASVRYYLAK